MLERLLELDRDLFVWLNALGSKPFDGFWLFITKQFNWIPIFAIIAWLAFKRLGRRHALLVLGLIALLIILTDQTTNFFKGGFQLKQLMVIPVIVLILYAVYKSRGWHLILVVSFVFILGVAILFNMTDFLETGFQRLRPGNNPEIAHFIRAVQKRSSYSFISGHASNSMACAYFLFRVLRPYLKYMGFIFIWPLVFAYSRIYLGLHYPGDILMGYVWGLITASLMLLLYRYLRDKWFPEKEELDHPTNSEPISDR